MWVVVSIGLLLACAFVLSFIDTPPGQCRTRSQRKSDMMHAVFSGPWHRLLRQHHQDEVLFLDSKRRRVHSSERRPSESQTALAVLSSQTYARIAESGQHDLSGKRLRGYRSPAVLSCHSHDQAESRRCVFGAFRQMTSSVAEPTPAHGP
jgi:hypothetical protein